MGGLGISSDDDIPSVDEVRVLISREVSEDGELVLRRALVVRQGGRVYVFMLDRRQCLRLIREGVCVSSFIDCVSSAEDGSDKEVMCGKELKRCLSSDEALAEHLMKVIVLERLIEFIEK